MNAPARSQYQAVVDFFPFEGQPQFAYALIKLSYRIDDTRCIPIEPEPLFHAVRDPKIKPRGERGSDFLPQKVLTDVAVRGSAFAFAGKPVPSRRVSVSVGHRRKEIPMSIQVNGDAPVRYEAPPSLYAELQKAQGAS